jgi:hypothetical protein
MQSQESSAVWIHRIVHESNLPFILQHGMLTRRVVEANPEYVFIGDTQLTNDRHEFAIPLEGCGNLGDYVPFYFGPRSPMLYNIITGYRGLKKRPQSEIIYLCIRLDSIIRAGLRFVFTDGHATKRLTNFFQSVEKLNQIDWETVRGKYWNDTEEDRDRQRRKQAECLVYERVPADLIDAIVVLNDEKVNFVNELLSQAGRTIPVHVNPRGAFYYL